MRKGAKGKSGLRLEGVKAKVATTGLSGSKGNACMVQGKVRVWEKQKRAKERMWQGVYGKEGCRRHK